MYGPVHFFTLRPTAEDPGTAAMLAFNSKWLEPLVQGKVSVVFRKVGPSFTPKLLYAYFSTPISAIAARLSVERYERLPVEAAVDLARDGLLTPAELRSYARKWSQLVVYRIGEVQAAQRPIAYSVLRERFDYYISSTFTSLSTKGAATLDDLGVFRRSQPR